MHYYFDSGNRLHISGSDYTPEIKKEVKKLYKFDQITLPLGSGFSQFLNADIELWGNNFKSLLSEMISNYNESKIQEYISQATALFAKIPYFSVYHALFYNELLLAYKHPDIMINMCTKIYEFLQTKTPLLPQNLPYPLDVDSKPIAFKGEIDRLKETQNLFRELTELCLSPNISNPLKEMYDHQEKTYYEHRYKLKEGIVKGFDIIPTNTRFEFNKKSQGKYEAVEVHTTNDIYDICYREFINLALNNVRIRRCENKDCKKYFVPLNRLDTLYCDECKDAGIAMKIYQNKLKENSILKAYSKAYQSKYAKMVKPYRTNPVMKEKKLKTLNEWIIDAKKRIAVLEVLSGDKRKKAEKELLDWLNQKEEK